MCVGLQRVIRFILTSEGPDVIGATLDELQARYGAVNDVNRYRPDLYPTSYEFTADSAKLEATLLDGRCVYEMVAYEEAPSADLVEKLALFSGFSNWVERSSGGDSRFGIHFPLFDPIRNRFFAERDESAFAMVQQDVQLGALVLWLSARDYPQMLSAYRALRRAQ